MIGTGLAPRSRTVTLGLSNFDTILSPRSRDVELIVIAEVRTCKMLTPAISLCAGAPGQRLEPGPGNVDQLSLYLNFEPFGSLSSRRRSPRLRRPRPGLGPLITTSDMMITITDRHRDRPSRTASGIIMMPVMRVVKLRLRRGGLLSVLRHGGRLSD
jgi:hypothetical protein